MGLSAALSESFASWPDRDAVPAASMAAVVDGQEVVAAWGVEPSAVFQAASISKPVAALVALELVADRSLELDADVNQFLTSWQLPGDAGADPVTVRHLLCHGGGLSVDGFPGYRQTSRCPASPTSWTACRHAIPRRCARTARPAGMTTATFAQPDPASAAVAHVAGREEAWRVYPEHAAAGLWCTPTDLLRMAQAIQAAVAGDGGALLPAELALELVTPQLGDWGLGLRVSGGSGTRTFGHDGNYGYVCSMAGAAYGQDAVAVMTSSDQGVPLLEAITAAITAGSC